MGRGPTPPAVRVRVQGCVKRYGHASRASRTARARGAERGGATRGGVGAGRPGTLGAAERRRGGWAVAGPGCVAAYRER
ncbi:predicted protein [Streptomyces sp. SPB78]|nr:predicted protein [Streptomyces sp. SPB78]